MNRGETWAKEVGQGRGGEGGHCIQEVRDGGVVLMLMLGMLAVPRPIERQSFTCRSRTTCAYASLACYTYTLKSVMDIRSAGVPPVCPFCATASHRYRLSYRLRCRVRLDQSQPTAGVVGHMSDLTGQCASAGRPRGQL